MKKFFKEFKEFISRGNVVDLAVAVIIGGAFSAIVTALTNKIVMPVVNFIIAKCGADKGLESAYTFLSKVYTEGELDLTKSIYIDWGAFIAAILNFLIIAFTLFCLVKIFNASRKKIEELNKGLVAVSKKEIRNEMRQVREQAKKDGVAFKKAWEKHESDKHAEAEAKVKAEADAKAKEEQDKLNNSSTEDLLKQIIVILQMKK